jgi:pimeloyl-ACP methyl ester carboxylesterase
LPGLESAEADRSQVGLDDHVAAVVAAVATAGGRVVLLSHSGAAIVATAAADRVPHLVSRLVYVDTAPVADGTALDPDVPTDTVELPLPSFEDLRADGEDLTGLTDQHLAEFRARAVPQPTGPLRERVSLRAPARTAIPVTVIATAFTADQAMDWAKAGSPHFSGLLDHTDVGFVELPTSHWPMFSRPADLAAVLHEAAVRA